MQLISDLKIIGMDETRFPRIVKEPYIDLVFKLSHKAPADWCEDFNTLFSSHEYTVKIDASVGLFIVTWVRKMDEIVGHLDVLKQKITECNAAYIKKKAEEEAQAALKATEANKNAPGEQEILNKLIASLNFN